KLYSGARTLPELQALVLGEHRRARALAEIPEGLMARGPAGASVTIELFADLLSPLTRRAVDALTRIQTTHASDVRVQFRSLPLPFHPQAPLAHEAAIVAARSGHFWDLAGYVLDHQTSVSERELIEAAG